MQLVVALALKRILLLHKIGDKPIFRNIWRSIVVVNDHFRKFWWRLVLAEKAARFYETDSPLCASWSAADPATRAVLDILAEFLAEEFVARMKATAPKSEDQTDESSDLRPVQL